MITVILNAFRRQDYLREQLESVLSQTVSPERVLVWNNGKELNFSEFGSKVVIANSSYNFGVWARFAFALNAETEYVCVFDDDTIPAPRFFESCIKQMKSEPALLGARGLRFLSPNRYHPFLSYGWDSPNPRPEVVDIVGHAWFFKREWLSVFWRELPPINASRLVGEDMHFSYMLQKYLNIKTLVVPHPVDEKSIWGSNPDLALKLGTSKDAISQNSKALLKFDKALQYYTESGFKLFKEDKKSNISAIVVGPGLNRMRALKYVAKKIPYLAIIGKKIIKKLEKRNIHI